MPYHEIKTKGKKTYNYLVRTVRKGGTWQKKRKYIGKGKLPENQIEKELKKYEKELEESRYFDESRKEMIDFIMQKFNAYRKKAGKSGTENFNEWFFTELTYNSTAIEGSSLSKRETSMIINDNIVPKNARLKEISEVRNHKEALEFLLGYIGDVNEKLILKLHSIVLKNIKDDAGKYRKVPVFIMGENAIFPSPSDVPDMAKTLIRWYKENKSGMYPPELAIIFSMKFVSIHPFTDGNGRLSRLLMNYILKKNGYPEINIYVKERNNYLRAVRKANDGDHQMICDFAYRTLLKNYDFLKAE